VISKLRTQVFELVVAAISGRFVVANALVKVNKLQVVVLQSALVAEGGRAVLIGFLVH
jgi:hypothetical protein